MSWTDERAAELKRLWIQGLSAAEIAKRLGGISRNAVTGKIDRLGLTGRGRRKPRGGACAAAGAVGRMVLDNLRAEPKRARPLERPEESAFTPLEIVEHPAGPNAKPLLELSRRDCRFPVGPDSPKPLFCGEPRDRAGCPYCPVHRAIAWRGLPEDAGIGAEPAKARRPMERAK